MWHVSGSLGVWPVTTDDMARWDQPQDAVDNPVQDTVDEDTAAALLDLDAEPLTDRPPSLAEWLARALRHINGWLDQPLPVSVRPGPPALWDPFAGVGETTRPDPSEHLFDTARLERELAQPRRPDDLTMPRIAGWRAAWRGRRHAR
jgi:hypothetical protein